MFPSISLEAYDCTLENRERDKRKNVDELSKLSLYDQLKETDTDVKRLSTNDQLEN